MLWLLLYLNFKHNLNFPYFFQNRSFFKFLNFSQFCKYFLQIWGYFFSMTTFLFYYINFYYVFLDVFLMFLSLRWSISSLVDFTRLYHAHCCENVLQYISMIWLYEVSIVELIIYELKLKINSIYCMPSVSK